MQAFSVSLRTAPTEDVTASVSITSGGSHASVEAGASLTFTSGSYTDRNVTIRGTNDDDQIALDNVRFEITTTSDDSNYNGLRVIRDIKIVDDDAPVEFGLKQYGQTVSLTEGNQVLTMEIQSSRIVNIPVEFRLTFTGQTGDFNSSEDIGYIQSYIGMGVGETKATFSMGTYDDDLVERNATALVDVSINNAPIGYSMKSGQSSFTLKHMDDDPLNIYISTTSTENVYALLFNRARDFDLTAHLVPADPDDAVVDIDFDASSSTSYQSYNIGDIADLKGIAIRTPANFDMRPNWQWTQSGVVIIANDDPIPSSFPTITTSVGGCNRWQAGSGGEQDDEGLNQS